MSCKYNCQLCNKLIISNSVTFNGTSLVVNIPAGSYLNNCKYCIVIAQAIPATTTIYAPVVISIGTGTTLYPLTNCDCRQVTACGVRTRTKYSVVVKTSGQTGGTFRMLSQPCCQHRNDARSLTGGTTALPAAAQAAAPVVAVGASEEFPKDSQATEKGGAARA